jgi:hypothetical protein
MVEGRVVRHAIWSQPKERDEIKRLYLHQIPLAEDLDGPPNQLEA